MTMQEIKNVFPEYKIGMASVSDLNTVFGIIGLSVDGFANLDSDNVKSGFIVDGEEAVVGKAGSRPMLIASFLRMYLKQVGGENLFPAEVTGEVSVSELKAIMVKFASDYVVVEDEVVPTPPVGTPTVITNFAASENLLGAIEFTWEDSLGASSYDLYSYDGASTLLQAGVRSGVVIEIEAGTSDYLVTAVSSNESTMSNIDEGTSLLEVPSAIEDFAASDAEDSKVTFTFSDADRATSYDLYVDGVEAAVGVVSGENIALANGESAIYMVKAINDSGSTDSNSDEGSAVAA